VHAHPQVPIITWTTTCYVYISGIREGGIYSSAYAVQLAEQLVKQLVEEHGVHALEILVRMGAGWIVTLGTVKLRWCVCVYVCMCVCVWYRGWRGGRHAMVARRRTL
jgi:hypothetical protein